MDSEVVWGETEPRRNHPAPPSLLLPEQPSSGVYILGSSPGLTQWIHFLKHFLINIWRVYISLQKKFNVRKIYKLNKAKTEFFYIRICSRHFFIWTADNTYLQWFRFFLKNKFFPQMFCILSREGICLSFFPLNCRK